MKIAVWEASHEISQTVSKSLAKGFRADLRHTKDARADVVREYDVHIAYGILRGCADVFRLCDEAGLPWFNVDRGYFQPGYFHGYYRLSFRGTQAKWHANGPKREHSLELLPMRRQGEYTIICPPTIHVANFFGIKDDEDWRYAQKIALEEANELYITRYKGEDHPINWDRVKRIAVFNSSLGWEALRRGIPVISDPQHSVVGSYQATKSIDTWDRNELFSFMRAHDFTLAELERGKALTLLNHYLFKFSSDGTAAKPSLTM